MRKTFRVATLLCALIIPSHASVIAAGSSYTATVKVDSLNVRDEASTKAAVISSLSNGQKVKVLDEAYGWSQIQANGVTGWVAGYYLSKTTATITTKQTAALGDGVRIRVGPGTQSIYRLPSS